MGIKAPLRISMSSSKKSSKPSNLPKQVIVWENPPSSKKNKKPKRSNRRFRRSKGTRVPVAYGTTNSSFAYTMSAKDGSTVLRCREIFQITATNKDGQKDGLDFALPVCPTKWVNTRTSTISSAFTQFRPTSLRVHWEPAVSTSTPGSLAFGTLWSGARLPTGASDFDTLSSALVCTNGGFITTVWAKAGSAINVGRNLRANGFPMYEVSADDIPLWLMCISSVTSGPIGQLVVEMTCTLRNPISGAVSPPIAGSQDIVMTHDDQTSTTTATMSSTGISRVLRTGEDIVLAFSRALVNTAGEVMTQILSPVIASVESFASNTYTLRVDPAYGTQTGRATIVGLTNF